MPPAMPSRFWISSPKLLIQSSILTSSCTATNWDVFSMRLPCPGARCAKDSITSCPKVIFGLMPSPWLESIICLLDRMRLVWPNRTLICKVHDACAGAVAQEV